MVMGFMNTNYVQQKQYKDRSNYVTDLVKQNRSKGLYNPWEFNIKAEEKEIIYNNLKINGELVKDLISYNVKIIFTSLLEIIETIAMIHDSGVLFRKSNIRNSSRNLD